MKKILFLVLLMTGIVYAQTPARFDLPALMTTPSQVPSGSLPNLLAITNATISVCGYPATVSAGMCTNTITTYTDSTLSTACPSSAQLTAPGSSVCVSTTGLQGNVGFWYDSSAQIHMTYTVKTSWGTFGPYEIAAPRGAAAAGGTNGDIQVNNDGALGKATSSQIQSAVGNWTNPVQSAVIADSFIVGPGTGQFSTISAALAAACATGSSQVVTILATATPADTPTSATGGCLAVTLTDNRTTASAGSPALYQFQQGFYYAQSGNWQQYAQQRIADIQNLSIGGDNSHFLNAASNGTVNTTITGDSITECAALNVHDCHAAVWWNTLKSNLPGVTVNFQDEAIGGRNILDWIDSRYFSQSPAYVNTCGGTAGFWCPNHAYSAGDSYTVNGCATFLVTAAYTSGASWPYPACTPSGSDLTYVVKISPTIGYYRSPQGPNASNIWVNGSIWVPGITCTRASNVATCTASSTSSLTSGDFYTIIGGAVGGSDFSFDTPNCSTTGETTNGTQVTFNVTGCTGTLGVGQQFVVTGLQSLSFINGQLLTISSTGTGTVTANCAIANECGTYTRTEAGVLYLKTPITVVNSTTFTYPSYGTDESATGYYAVAQNWQDAIAATNPDLLIVGLGQNSYGNQTIFYRKYLNDLTNVVQGWNPVPTLMFETNYLPTKYASPYASEQQGLLAISQVTREYSKQNNYLYIDLGRIEPILRDGLDYGQLTFEEESNYLGWVSGCGAVWCNVNSNGTVTGVGNGAALYTMTSGNIGGMFRTQQSYDVDITAQLTIGTGATVDMYARQDADNMLTNTAYDLQWTVSGGNLVAALYTPQGVVAQAASTVPNGSTVRYQVSGAKHTVSAGNTVLFTIWDYTTLLSTVANGGGYSGIGVSVAGTTNTTLGREQINMGNPTTFAGPLVPESFIFGVGTGGPGTSSTCGTVLNSMCGDTVHHVSVPGSHLVFDAAISAAVKGLTAVPVTTYAGKFTNINVGTWNGSTPQYYSLCSGALFYGGWAPGTKFGVNTCAGDNSDFFRDVRNGSAKAWENSGNYFGGSFQATGSGFGGFFTGSSGTGSIVTRNSADAVSVLTVRNQSAASTGDPIQAQNSSSVKLGGVTVTGTTYGQSLGVIGSTFTVSGACSPTTATGGATGGSFLVSATGSCAITVTMGGSQMAAHGWACHANDLTTPANVVPQSATTTTTATFTGTVTNADLINFECIAY